ncbi:MAG: hypothetical protein ABNH02_06775 [Pseudomonadales bacterium]
MIADDAANLMADEQRAPNNDKKDDDCQKSGSTPTSSMPVGNPIELLGSIKVEVVKDYQSYHRLPLEESRLYRSDSDDLSEFGRGWSSVSKPLLTKGQNFISIAFGGRLFVFGYDESAPQIYAIDGNSNGTSLYVIGDEWVFSSPTQKTVRFRAGDSSQLGFGRVRSITSSVGDQLTYSYQDNLSQLPSEVTHSSGAQINYQYSTLSGVSCSGYECNKVVNTISTDLGTWDYNYDSSGRLTEVITPEGVTTGYIYDSSHRLIGRTDDNGTRIRWWGYDSNGRANLSRKYGYEEEVTVVYSSFYSSEFGRTVTQAQINDEKGRVTNVIYAPDDLGVPRILKNQAVGDVSCPGGVELFGYDSETGRLASEITAGGVLATYSYDTFGYPIARTETVSASDEVTVSRSYHSQVWGKLDNETYRYNGQNQNRVSYTYCTTNSSSCKVGLPKTMVVSDLLQGGSRTTNWSYSVNSNGRVTKVEMTSPTGVIQTVEYNDAGLVTRQLLNGDVQLQVLSYGAAGLPTSVQYENLYKVNTSYNNDGQPTQVSYQMLDGSSTLTATYEYNNLGQLVNVVRPSSQTTTGESFDYDQNGRLITRSLGTWADEEPDFPPPPPIPDCNPWESTCFNEL